MNSDIPISALSYWRLGIEYLHLAQITIQETIDAGNPFVVVANDQLSIEEIEQQTKWSDHQIVVPTLFLFYHGIELILKGFLLHHSQESIIHHKLKRLLKEYAATYGNNDIARLVAKYIRRDTMPELIDNFLTSSRASIDDYHQAFRYPASSKGSGFEHSKLKYMDYHGLPFFVDMVQDISTLRRRSVSEGLTLLQRK